MTRRAIRLAHFYKRSVISRRSFGRLLRWFMENNWKILPLSPTATCADGIVLFNEGLGLRKTIYSLPIPLDMETGKASDMLDYRNIEVFVQS